METAIGGRSRTLQMTPVLQKVLTEHKKTQKQFGFESNYVFFYQGKKSSGEMT